MLTVHGRTRAQFYSGRADWETPSGRWRTCRAGRRWFANGDVVDAASARAALAQSGADAVMVGRGAQGAPWRLAQIAHELWARRAACPAGRALADAVAEHYDDILSLYGQELGLRRPQTSGLVCRGERRPKPRRIDARRPPGDAGSDPRRLPGRGLPGLRHRRVAMTAAPH